MAPPSVRLSDDWLKARITEFENFCFPSVTSQSSQEFKWVIFCDPDSPQWFKDYMSAKDDHFTTIFTNELRRINVGRVLREHGILLEGDVISSRIDNDDAIPANYIATVQGLYSGQERTFIEFPFGLR